MQFQSSNLHWAALTGSAKRTVFLPLPLVADARLAPVPRFLPLVDCFSIAVLDSAAFCDACRVALVVIVVEGKKEFQLRRVETRRAAVDQISILRRESRPAATRDPVQLDASRLGADPFDTLPARTIY